MARMLHAVVVLMGLLEAMGHGYVAYPKSRSAISPAHNCAHCMNGAGPERTRRRQQSKANFSKYGLGATQWPHDTLLEQGKKSNPGGLIMEPDDIAVRHGVCGDPSQNSPDTEDKYNKAIKNYTIPAQNVYKSGSIIEVEVILTAHHRGHFEFFLCDTTGMSRDATLTQSCFNRYPLERVYRPTDVSPVDPNFPYRYYVEPNCYKRHTPQNGVDLEGNSNGHRFKIALRLPAIVSNHAVLQWYYWTANSCLPHGYSDAYFNGITKKCQENWITMSLTPCKNSYPEEFWNCSDIKISNNTSEIKPKVTSPPPAPTQPGKGAVKDGTWDYNWNLGGSWNRQANKWLRICDCKTVTYKTIYKTKEACVTDWLKTDPSCDPNSRTAPRPTKWARNHDLGGKSTPEGWRKHCDCHLVSWNTNFTDQTACRNDWISKDKACLPHPSPGPGKGGGNGGGGIVPSLNGIVLIAVLAAALLQLCL